MPSLLGWILRSNERPRYKDDVKSDGWLLLGIVPVHDHNIRRRFPFVMLVAIVMFGFMVSCGSSEAIEDVLPSPLAFIRNGDIIVLTADGEERRVFNRDGYVIWGGGLAISPDGSKFAFTKRGVAPRRLDIFIANDDGTGEIRITDSAATNWWPTWSPDGTRLVYESSVPNVPYKFELYVVDVDGSNRRRLIEAPYADRQPDWSPDGSRVVFSRRVPHPGGLFHESNDICLVEIDGMEPTCITDTVGAGELVWQWGPRWSPDGTKIAFKRSISAQELLNTRTYLINSDGSASTRLTNINAVLSWSSDGTKIAFECGPGGVSLVINSSICVADADGSNAVGVAQGTSPVWVP